MNVAADILSQIRSTLNEQDLCLALSDILYDLGGRYVLIAHINGKTYVTGDACGTRSVFFSSCLGVIASHSTMFDRLTEAPRKRSLPYGFSVFWDLRWDLTSIAEVFSVVPNHIAILENGSQYRFYPLTENPALSLSDDDRLRLIETLWSEQLRATLSTGRPIALSISGGLDSRTTLALARDLAEQMVAFTYTTFKALEGLSPATAWERSMEIDFQIVSRLKPLLKMEHHFLPLASEEDAGVSWVLKNSSLLDMNSDEIHGRKLLPRYLKLFPFNKTIHYRGNLLELSRLYLGGQVGEYGRPGLRRIFDLDCKTKNATFNQVAQLTENRMEFLEWNRISDSYDLTDILYMEQRMGRWLSQVLNETDVVFDTITPMNVRRVIDPFLAFSPDQRRTGYAQRELIHRCNPYLSFLEFKQPVDLYERYLRSS